MADEMRPRALNAPMKLAPRIIDGADEQLANAHLQLSLDLVVVHPFGDREAGEIAERKAGVGIDRELAFDPADLAGQQARTEVKQTALDTCSRVASHSGSRRRRLTLLSLW
jgi:hypothetical protein